MRLWGKESVFLILISIIFLSCSVPLQQRETEAPTREISEQTYKRPAQVEIEKIAVIPFSTREDYLQGELRDYFSLKEQFLTTRLYEELSGEEMGVKIASLEGSASKFTGFKKQDDSKTYREVSARVGKELGADAVLVGRISEYRERVGGSYGVESPSSVAFSVELLNSENGDLIWETYYSETQEPLLQNVTKLKKFLERGGKWVTADELAMEGVIEIAERLDAFLAEYSASE